MRIGINLKIIFLVVSSVIVGMSRQSLFGFALPPGSPLPDIIFFVCGGLLGGAGGAIYTSSDGASWTARTSGSGSLLLNIDSGGGLWIAVGDTGTVATSVGGAATAPSSMSR